MPDNDLVLRPTVLVVDDSESFSRAIKETLSDFGFDVLVANDAYGASKLLRGLTPDLILLDVRMPGMDGLRYLRMLKTHLSGGIVPVLIISAEEDPEIHKEAMDAGADGFLSKESTVEELKKTLGEFLTVKTSNTQ